MPESINEIWVTDYHYESVYHDDGDEIGEKLLNINIARYILDSICFFEDNMKNVREQ